MSENQKSTPFIRILSAFFIHAASDKGRSRDLTDEIVGSHQHHSQARKATLPQMLKPETRNMVKPILQNVTPIARRRLKGHAVPDFEHDPMSTADHQTMAEHIDHVVSGNVHKYLREDPQAKARRTLQEIAEEIVKKAGW